MSRPIINVADVELHTLPEAFAATGSAAEIFDAHAGFVGRSLGAPKPSYNITAVPPGKRTFSFHNHRVNEEMFFILEGEGKVRIGNSRYPIRIGDIIACPAGGPETAHQIINTSKVADIKYLAVSTQLSPEIAEYPDSGKFGVLAEFPPNAADQPQGFRFVSRQAANIDYWEDE